MKPLILDSALGTELENRGEYLPSFKTSIWSAYSLIHNPEVIKQIHIDNIEAGADVITTSNYPKFDETSINNSKKLIRRVLSATIENPDNPESLNFFQSDTYRFYFLMSFMKEALEGNEISQEYAISLVPKKFASRIKRLQVLKQAVQLGYIIEKSSEVDRRRRIYFPSELLLNDFVKYANDSDRQVKLDKSA
jgi:hypothetical protein